SPETPAAFSAFCDASASPRMWSSCDCVAKSGSSCLRWSGYSETAEPITPLALSTSETRTLSVPKSTPATMAMVNPREQMSDTEGRCQRTILEGRGNRLSSDPCPLISDLWHLSSRLSVIGSRPVLPEEVLVVERAGERPGMRIDRQRMCRHPGDVFED